MSDRAEPSQGYETREAARAPVPRWVKLFGLIVLALVAVLVVAQLTAGRQHGPDLHATDPQSGPATTVGDGHGA